MAGFNVITEVKYAPSFRNLQHRLADRIFDWAKVGAVHIQAPPYYESVRALVSRSVATQNTVFLPWGDGEAVIPLAGADDAARVAATVLAKSGVPSQTVLPLINETLTVREIVSTLSTAIGRPIRYVQITDEQCAEAVKERINPHALDHLTHLWQYFRKNGESFRSTDTVREVTGRKPQMLEEFFRQMLDSSEALVKRTCSGLDFAKESEPISVGQRAGARAIDGRISSTKAGIIAWSAGGEVGDSR